MPAAPLSELTLLLLCPVCSMETGEPIGVTGRPDRSLEGTVVIQCADCATVYVSPYRPDAGDAPSRGGESRSTAFRRSAASLPDGARILCDDPDAVSRLAALPKGWRVDTGDRPCAESLAGKESYDLVLLSRSLCSEEPPSRTLARAAAAVKPGGHVIAVTDNVGSSCFEVFRGRHWSGYDFPRSRQCLSSVAFRRLAESEGLTVRNISTRFSSDVWIESVRNWLRDWGAHRFLVTMLAGDWLLPRGVLSLLEWIAVARGKGALLVVDMEKE